MYAHACACVRDRREGMEGGRKGGEGGEVGGKEGGRVRGWGVWEGGARARSRPEQPVSECVIIVWMESKMQHA